MNAKAAGQADGLLNHPVIIYLQEGSVAAPGALGKPYVPEAFDPDVCGLAAPARPAPKIHARLPEGYG